MKTYFSFIFFFLFSVSIYDQYSILDQKSFFELSKLDDTIIIDKNFDYELINLAVMHYTNKHRNVKSKKSLDYNEGLEKWAFIHSSEMKKYHFFAHINKKSRLLRDVDDRADYVQYQNYKELAENLYYGFIDLRKLPTYKQLALTITKAFISSKAHNQNLLNSNVEEMGGFILFKDESKNGFLHYYFTQSFGAKY